MNGPIEAVIFDMDGVLVNSEPLHQSAETEALAAHGIAVTAEDLHAYIGATRKSIQEDLERKHGPGYDWDAVFELKDRRFFERAGELELFPNARDIVRDIKDAGFKTAIGTSSRRRLLDYILDRFALRALIDAPVCADDIVNGKPDPEIFLTGAARLGIDPAKCVVIEDSFNGIKAAKAAGMRAVGVTTSLPADRLSEADRIIGSLDELYGELELETVGGWR